MKQVLFSCVLLGGLILSPFAAHADGRIKGTGGVSSISGGGGGGLIPWATLTSLAAKEQRGFTAFVTHTDVDDFTLCLLYTSPSPRDRG